MFPVRIPLMCSTGSCDPTSLEASGDLREIWKQKFKKGINDFGSSHLMILTVLSQALQMTIRYTAVIRKSDKTIGDKHLQPLQVVWREPYKN